MPTPTTLLYACVRPIDGPIDLGKIVCKDRLAQIEATPSSKAKEQRRAVWSLMEQLAFRMLAENGRLQNGPKESVATKLDSLSKEELYDRIRKENWSFTRLSSGKWLCDRFFFSLSHTDDFVAAAVSTESVGIDVENKLAFDRRFFQKEERLLERIRTSESEAGGALTLWTQKEAITKCEGKDRFIPKLIRVCDYPVFTKQSPMWTCSVCSSLIDKILWIE